MRVNTWSDREPGWWYKGLFQKKVLLLLGGLLLFASVGLSVIYSRYNKKAIEAWSEAEDMFVAKYGSLDPKDFYENVPEDEDFLKNPFIKGYLEDEGRELTTVFNMDVWGITGDSEWDYDTDRDDPTTWFEGVAEPAAAARRALENLTRFDSVVSELEYAVEMCSQYESDNRGMAEVVDTESLYDSSIFPLFYLSQFFSSRAKLHLIAGDRQLSIQDLLRANKLAKMQLVEKNALSFLIFRAHISGFYKYLELSLEGNKHPWTSEDIDRLTEILDVDIYKKSHTDFYIGEFLLFRHALNLYYQKLESGVEDEDLTEGMEMSGMFGDLEIEWVDKLDMNIDYAHWVASVKPRQACRKYGAESVVLILNNVIWDVSLENEALSLKTYRKNAKAVDDRGMMPQAYCKFYGDYLTTATKMRLWLAGLEVERYYLKNGRYPKSLSEVLDDRLLCPFTGGPVIYSHDAGGFQIETYEVDQADIDARLFSFVKESKRSLRLFEDKK